MKTIQEILSAPVAEYTEAKGLLKSIEEKSAKNGSSFVSGFIADKKSQLNFKIWDMTLARLSQISDTPIEAGKVVCIKGDLKEYQEEWSLQMKEIKNRVGIEVYADEDPAVYAYSAPYEGSKMLASIKKEVSGFKNETLKKITETVIGKYEDKLLFYPYGKVIHSERCGLLYFIFNTFSRIKKVVMPVFDGEKCVIDEELLETAAICHRLDIFERYEVDEVGVITGCDELSYLLLGGLKNQLTLVEAIKDIPDLDRTVVDKLLHILYCVNAEMTPAFPEAELFKNFVDEEIKVYTMFEQTRAVEGNEIIKCSVLDRKIVKID